MSLDRTRVEQQLSRAKEELGTWVKALEQQGVASDAHRADPRWRSLNARVRQIGKRLKAIGGVEKVNAECETRKAEKAAAAEAADEPAPPPEPAPKAKKEKGEKAEKAPKAPKEKKPKE